MLCAPGVGWAMAAKVLNRQGRKDLAKSAKSPIS
jgi:hypothetical protein